MRTQNRNASDISQATTFVNVLATRARQSPDALAFKLLEDGEQDETSITFGELDRQARAIAAQMQTFAHPGERALLLYPPGLAYVAALFGCMYAGVVAVPAYPPDPMRLDRTLPRLQAMLADAQVSVILTSAPILALAELMFNQAPDLEALQWMATDLVPDSMEANWVQPQLTGNSLACLQYTSGSTRTPRGVMVRHSNLLDNVQLIKDAFGIGKDDVGVIWLPPYHDMGLIGGLLEPVYNGIPSILIPTLAFLQRPLRWLQTISRYHATVSGGPDFAYELCVRKATPETVAQLDLSSWAVAFTGAEPVRQATLDRFCQVFEPCGFSRRAFYPCYGLAEATLIVSGGERNQLPRVWQIDPVALAEGRAVIAQEAAAGSPSAIVLEHREKRNLLDVVSCGRPLAGFQAVIVQPESCQPCAPGQVGEIWLSGPSVAGGYWDHPNETQQVFHAQLESTDPVQLAAQENQSAEVLALAETTAAHLSTPPESKMSYLRTGDLGFFADDELVIVGRIKDLIIIDGLNHYPQDIEHTLENCHPAVRPGCAAAFSIEQDGEERLVAVAEVDLNRITGALRQASPDAETTAQRLGEVAQAIRRATSLHHDVRVYDLRLLLPRTIPKTSSGKIQRHACKMGYLEGTLTTWRETPASRETTASEKLT